MSTPTGTIYLLHVQQPEPDVPNPQGTLHERPRLHYLGWTADLSDRLLEHATGRGARLTAVLQQEGLRWVLARTWSGDRSIEKKLKRQGGRSRLCPLCRGTGRAG